MELIRDPVPGDIDGNWMALLDFVGNNVSEDVDAVINMMEGLEHDIEYGDNKVWLGFKHAPAGRRNHHSFYGGLTSHVMEMLGLAAEFLHVLERRQELHPYFFSDDNIIKAVLFHDIHKNFKTFSAYKKDVEDGVYNVWRSNHSSDNLMSTDLKTLYLLNKWQVPFDPVMVNAIFGAEGGYADHETAWTTSLAVFINVLDSSSANILSRAADNTEYNVRVPSDKPWEETYG